MNLIDRNVFKVAILDLYEGVANEGMRCLRALVREFAQVNDLDLQLDEFEVRQHIQLPDLSYDVYISSGGPGSPLDSEGSAWENAYFNWIKTVEDYNASPAHPLKKQIFFICHSFQLACRYFDIATVAKRKSTAFGVFPVHMLENGKEEVVLKDFNDPFYAVDSRDFQVIQPKIDKLEEMGGAILAIEKERPHVPLERAVMAIRFNEYMIGTQFHPEADAIGMSMYLQREDKKNNVIENHGFEKWDSMIEQLSDPEKILFTYSTLLPNFLTKALEHQNSFITQ